MSHATNSADLVTLTIDEVPVTAPAGTSILHAALAAGIAIGVADTPHLSLGVDVPGDVKAVEALLESRGLA